MQDEIKGLFDQPIENLSPVYRDTREDMEDTQSLDVFKPEETVEEQPVENQPVETTTVGTPEAPVAEQVIRLFEPVQEQTAETPQASAPIEQKDWKALLKEQGFDDYALGVLEYYKSTGDLTPYVEAKSVDYSKLSDEEILRRDLRSRYSELSDDDFDLLYQKRVVDKYKLDEIYDDTERRIGQIELKDDVRSIRDRLVEQQKNFRAPERTVDQSVDINQQVAEQYNQWKQVVDSDPTTQSLLNTKRISVGDGEQVVNFELESADKILQSTYDPNAFFSSFVKPDGNVDLQKWYKAVAYAQNMQAFERAVINYGKTIGRQEVFNEIKNPPKPEVGSVPGGPTGKFKDDLLSAFATEGISRG
jgi:hypothetical protein